MHDVVSVPYWEWDELEKTLLQNSTMQRVGIRDSVNVWLSRKEEVV